MPALPPMLRCRIQSRYRCGCWLLGLQHVPGSAQVFTAQAGVRPTRTHVRRSVQWKPPLLKGWEWLRREPGMSLDSWAVRPWVDGVWGGQRSVFVLQRTREVDTETRGPPGGAGHASTDGRILGGIDLKRACRSIDGDSDHCQRREHNSEGRLMAPALRRAAVGPPRGKGTGAGRRRGGKAAPPTAAEDQPHVRLRRASSPRVVVARGPASASPAHGCCRRRCCDGAGAVARAQQYQHRHTPAWRRMAPGFVCFDSSGCSRPRALS
jgi:hypothetical protein